MDPRSCTLRVFKFTKKNLCDSNVWVAKEIDGEYRSRLLPYLTTHNVEVFDPFKIMCGDVKCKTTDGDKILWADSGHMSRAGSQFLVREGF
ncbi:SGNH hydrolase domain-containing protein, partial [Acinetobacter baumannii]